jgi:hypothetical protein
MQTRHFTDFCNIIATIKELPSGKFNALLTTKNGTRIRNTEHVSFRAARAALGRDSDGLREVDNFCETIKR